MSETVIHKVTSNPVKMIKLLLLQVMLKSVLFRINFLSFMIWIANKRVSKIRISKQRRMTALIFHQMNIKQKTEISIKTFFHYREIFAKSTIKMQRYIGWTSKNGTLNLIKCKKSKSLLKKIKINVLKHIKINRQG